MPENESEIGQGQKPRVVETSHYPFGDFDNFTKAIRNQLEVDIGAFYRPPGEELPDFEDQLVPFMNEVRFTENAVPHSANIGMTHGITVGPESQNPQLDELPANLVENVSKAEALAALALTKAKLEVVLDSLKDVYPTPPEKAQEYLNAIEFLREELVKDKRAEVSLASGLRRLRLNPRFAVLSLIVLGGMLLASCASERSGLVSPTQTDTSPNQPVSTETTLIEDIQEQPTETAAVPTELPTEVPATPTEAPTEAPTPTEVVQEHAPGELVWNERYNLEGKLDIIQENQEGFRNFTFDGLIAINPEYFEGFNQEYNQNITNADELVNWLKENDWVLPLLSDGTGIRLIKRGIGGDTVISRGYPLDAGLDLRNLQLLYLTPEEYQKETEDYNNQYIDPNKMAYTNIYFNNLITKIGIMPLEFQNDKGEKLYKLVIVVASKHYETLDKGPYQEEISQSSSDEFNLAVGFAVYALRSLRLPTEVYYPTSADTYYRSGGVETIDDIDFAQSLGLYDGSDEYQRLLMKVANGEPLEWGPPPPPDIVNPAGN